MSILPAQTVTTQSDRESFALPDGHPHAEVIKALRDLADLLAANPDLPMPRHGISLTGSLTEFDSDSRVGDAASLAQMRLAAEILGVQVEAEYSDHTHAWHHRITTPGSLRLGLVHMVRDADGGAA